MANQPKLGADTRMDPLHRLLQSVLKSVKTARLCYLERPTPVSTSRDEKSHLQNSGGTQIVRRHSYRPAASFAAIRFEIGQNGEARLTREAGRRPKKVKTHKVALAK